MHAQQAGVIPALLQRTTDNGQLTPGARPGLCMQRPKVTAEQSLLQRTTDNGQRTDYQRQPGRFMQLNWRPCRLYEVQGVRCRVEGIFNWATQNPV